MIQYSLKMGIRLINNLDINMKTMKAGDKVTWKAAGKVSRAMGVVGEIIAGKVKRLEWIDGEQYVHIDPRLTPFGKLGSLVPVSKILSVE